MPPLLWHWVIANLLNTPAKAAQELNKRTLTGTDLDRSRWEVALAIKQANEALLSQVRRLPGLS
jgi:hypothetical protein